MKAGFELVEPAGTARISAAASLQYYAPYAAVVLPHLLAPSLPWLPVWVVFGLVPLLDLVLPDDNSNVTEDDRREHEEDVAFKLPLYLWVPASYYVFLRGLGVVAAGRWTAGSLAGTVLATGLATGGVGFGVAHELFHHSSRLERGTAHVLLALTCYTHFMVEHVAGHHKRVGTPDDPASNLTGESIYRFVPRSAAGGFASALRKVGALEIARLYTGPACVLVLVAAAYGAAGVAFYFAQAAGAVFIIEMVNSLEHVYLRRERLADGTYEPVTPRHSWNASNVLTNALFFKVQRHSDHHANSKRRYFALRTFRESPTLPLGYSGMLVLSLFPRLFDWVMRPIMREYNAGGLVTPGKGRDRAAAFVVVWFVAATLVASATGAVPVLF